MTSILRDHPGKQLEEFVETELKPSAAEMDSFREDVEQFAKFLRDSFKCGNFTIAKVFKNGSIGRGTATKTSDIDLVVFFNGMRGINHLKETRPQLLECLEQQILTYSHWKGRIEKRKDSTYSVSYTLEKGRTVHEVDILPGFDLLEHVSSHPKTLFQKVGFANNRAITRGVRTRRNRRGQQYSVSLAPLQRSFMEDFFQSVHTTMGQSAEKTRENIKDTVRLLKFWKKENRLDIRNYTLELLTVHAFKSTHKADIAGLFREVMGMLVKCGTLTVAFNEYYNSEDYTCYRGPPYILDPANPFMNTLSKTRIGDVQRAARATLRQSP